MRPSLFCFVGIMGLAAVGCGSAASADDLKSTVRILNAIINPEDAWRLEDQARRYGHPAEGRYWHQYGAGLVQQRQERGEPVPQYGGPGRYSTPIDPDQANRLEDQARRYGRTNTQQYWGQYRQGLEGPPGSH
jgi:hypothetical protein